jgi:hypothetical protein
LKYSLQANLTIVPDERPKRSAHLGWITSPRSVACPWSRLGSRQDGRGDVDRNARATE